MLTEPSITTFTTATNNSNNQQQFTNACTVREFHANLHNIETHLPRCNTYVYSYRSTV